MKKTLVLCISLLLCHSSFAASTLFCETRDGGRLTAEESVSPEKAILFNVKYTDANGKVESYPNARAVLGVDYDVKGGDGKFR